MFTLLLLIVTASLTTASLVDDECVDCIQSNNTWCIDYTWWSGPQHTYCAEAMSNSSIASFTSETADGCVYNEHISLASDCDKYRTST